MDHRNNTTALLAACALALVISPLGPASAKWSSPLEAEHTSETATPKAEPATQPSTQPQAQPDAQPDAKSSSEPSLKTTSKPVLAGPRVSETDQSLAAPPTLIERDFAGRLVRLDEHPAQAAAKLLELSEDERTRVNDLLARRALGFDNLVRDRFSELQDLIGRARSGDPAQGRRTAIELVRIARPYLGDEQLVNQIAAVLQEPSRKIFENMVETYWSALIADEQGDETDMAAQQEQPQQRRLRDRRSPSTRIITVESSRLIGKEIERAIDRTLGQASRNFDELAQRLNLRPDQLDKVRLRGEAVLKESNYRPTPQQQAEMFRELWADLDNEQRAELLKVLRERDAQ